jgi:hypothetical protein
MTTLKIGFLTERSRSARWIVSQSRPAGPEAVEEALAEVLQIHEQFPALWNPLLKTLNAGQEAGSVRAFVTGALSLFDAWLHAARTVADLAEQVSGSGGNASALDRLREAIATTEAIEADARELLRMATLPPPRVSEESLRQAEEAYAAGRFRSTREIIAELDAK